MRIIFQIVLIVFIGSFSVELNAQTVEWGPEAKANRANGTLTSLGWHDGFLYNIEKDAPTSLSMGSGLYLEKLSEDMKLIFSKSIDVELGLYSNSLPVIVENTLKIYYVKIDRRPVKKSLFCDTYTLDGEKIRTDEISLIDSRPARDLYSSSYAMGVSPDKKKMAFVGIYSNKKTNSYDVSISTFNHDGSEFRKSMEGFSAKNELEKTFISELEVDSKGNVLMSYVVVEDKPDNRFTKLLFVQPGGEILLDQTLEFKDFYMGNVRLKVSESDELYFTGMLGSTNDDDRGFGGFFIGKFNSETFEIETVKPYSYTQEFFEGLGYKVKKDGQVKFSGYYSLELILNKAGGGFLIANHKDSYRSTGVVNKEIVTVSFNSNMDMDEPNAIPRIMNSYPPLLNGLGYFAFIHNDKLQLVYTDHVENIETNLVEEAYTLDNPKDRKAAIYLATVERGEGVKRTLLSTENKINGYLIPNKCQASDNRYVISLGNKNKVLYGEIKFD